ncbi:hypothetical protein BSKO_01184 [Bryopsis sp. KO-2023]|nr:hypothetical protein BSKO_01184 [Bryopsis sp. KO-2023]
MSMFGSMTIAPTNHVALHIFKDRRGVVSMIKPNVLARTLLCQAEGEHSPHSKDGVILQGSNTLDAESSSPTAMDVEDIAPGHQSPCNEVLNEIEMHKGREVRMETLERWERCYAALADEAVTMGIPRSVIPVVGDLSVETLTSCRNHLRGMIASFSSSGL